MKSSCGASFLLLYLVARRGPCVNNVAWCLEPPITVSRVPFWYRFCMIIYKYSGLLILVQSSRKWLFKFRLAQIKCSEILCKPALVLAHYSSRTQLWFPIKFTLTRPSISLICRLWLITSSRVDQRQRPMDSRHLLDCYHLEYSLQAGEFGLTQHWRTDNPCG